MPFSAALFAHGRKVHSPFDLRKPDERALTAALGYTLSRCLPFLQGFLRLVGLGGLRGRTLAGCEIHLERHYPELRSITDVEVRLPSRLHVVIEAKIGLGVPTLRQLRRYFQALKKSGAPRQALVALTATDGEPVIRRYQHCDEECRRLLVSLDWPRLRQLAMALLNRRGKPVEGQACLDAFVTFLERGYAMRSFTHEVWIVPVNMEPLWLGGKSFYDSHVASRIYYRGKGSRYRSVRPLYIALRLQKQVATIQRVTSIEHNALPGTYVPWFKNVPQSWPDEPHTIWFLDEPVALPKPIPTGGTLRARHVFCDMDVLLSSENVVEVAKRMKDRRQAEGRG